MEERLRKVEGFALISAEIHRLMEESQRLMEESQRRMEESQRQRDEVMDRMAHAIVLIQADIVRIDETR
jgi:hypothetical protein